MRKPKTKLGRIRQWLKRKWRPNVTRTLYYHRVVIVRTTPVKSSKP